MKVSSITLKVIKAPLKQPFKTHLETVTDREAIIVEAKDKDGLIGYGEAVPFTSPWYTEETIKTCYHMLEDFLIPLTLTSPLQHPGELQGLWRGIRRNAMAKSALEQAIFDLYAKQNETYLGRLFGGERREVAAGVVIASNNVEEAMRQIDGFSGSGYRRYKIKIDPLHDIEFLSHIRDAFPDIPLMADANSAYTLDDIAHLQKLDEYKLMMIEQPLGHDDIVEHSRLQSKLQTPICLDESINSYHDASSALTLGSCGVINIKMAKVGGWTEAVRIHDLCAENDVPVWCGGMIEFGISRAHNIALATLKGFTIPGDISSSSRYWEGDIIDPEVVVKDGLIQVPEKAGIGFSINEKRLKALTTYSQMYR
ncbi:o-succinylbenzoate synthase [Peribacillus sp. SI8-4]|uniref:o-succinylbenzoate synthase n=1 Tax=Peribacillus sp. SI8-4 TaxID=3048009 RepID=UPI0025576E9E|nr:o-succinylbenzoate synthase [Peribacillus sp. SI8-4]